MTACEPVRWRQSFRVRSDPNVTDDWSVMTSYSINIAVLHQHRANARCADCGVSDTLSLLAEVPPGARCVRASLWLAPAEFDALCASCRWRCRGCAGRVYQARATLRSRQRDAVIALVGSGGEWSVDAIHHHLDIAGVSASRQRLRNLLAAMADVGLLQRFDRGVYRAAAQGRS
jgi:hypothetical protein